MSKRHPKKSLSNEKHLNSFVYHHERSKHMKNCQMKGEIENMIVT
jgi:hypothetical protein